MYISPPKGLSLPHEFLQMKYFFPFGGLMYMSENYLRAKTIGVWMTQEAFQLRQNLTADSTE